MKQNKQTYLSPVTETLVIQSEGSFCGGPSANAFINPAVGIIYDDGTTNDNGDF